MAVCAKPHFSDINLKIRGWRKMGKGGMSVDDDQQNMAAWLVSLNTLKIQPFNLPSLGPHDVRIRMKAVGICGSDVHYLKTMRCADFIVKEPMVIGH
jgi:L-iditol 2-dehydrogenase